MAVLPNAVVAAAVVVAPAGDDATTLSNEAASLYDPMPNPPAAPSAAFVVDRICVPSRPTATVDPRRVTVTLCQLASGMPGLVAAGSAVTAPLVIRKNRVFAALPLIIR